MNLYHLRYFVTLAQIEHYTKAAEILNITQPSLTYAIKTLENKLGVKLFEKEGRNIVLNKYGQSFLKNVEKTLDILDSSVNKLQLVSKGEGELDIVMLRTLSVDLVPKLTRGFKESNPEKNINFNFSNSTGYSQDMIQELKERKHDIAFCSMIKNESSIKFTPILKQKFVLIVPEKHPLAAYNEIGLAETLSYPHIFFSEQSALRPAIDELFEKYEEKPIIKNTIGEDDSIAGLVSANFGIAVVPETKMLHNLPLKIINLKSATADRVFYMATLKDVYEPPVLKKFKKYVINTTKV